MFNVPLQKYFGSIKKVYLFLHAMGENSTHFSERYHAKFRFGRFKAVLFAFHLYLDDDANQ
jgi:hypothetical protein